MREKRNQGRGGEEGADQDEIEEGGLIDLDEVSVPGLEIVVGGGGGAVVGLGSLNVLLAVLDDLGKDLARNVRKGNSVVGAVVLDHVLNRLGFESHRLVDLESLAIGALQRYLSAGRHSF